MTKLVIIGIIVAIVVFTPIDDILAMGVFGKRKSPDNDYRSPVF